MSDENRADGARHYATGGAEARKWFERQWQMWPNRADERFTTNMSFLHGGVIAYRMQNAREPVLSPSLRSNLDWLDQSTPTPRSDGE